MLDFALVVGKLPARDPPNAEASAIISGVTFGDKLYIGGACTAAHIVHARWSTERATLCIWCALLRDGAVVVRVFVAMIRFCHSEGCDCVQPTHARIRGARNSGGYGG